MKEQDCKIIGSDHNQVLVIRDTFTTAIYPWDSINKRIQHDGNALIKTHLTAEQNAVTYRQTIGLLTTLLDESYTDFNYKEYFNITNASMHMMEVVDSLKIYNIKDKIEHIYVNIDDYENIDGSHIEHMEMCKKEFYKLIYDVHLWGI